MAGSGAAPGSSAGGLHPDDPAVLGRVAAGLRWTLAILAVLYAAFPGLLSSIFTSWITRPMVLGQPLGAGGSAQLHLGAFPWIVYLAMQVVHARLLRRRGAFPWSDGEVAAMALVPLYNLYGSWQLFDATAAGARRAGGSAGLALQIRAAAIASLALACLQVLLLLGLVSDGPGFERSVAASDWVFHVNAVALLLLGSRLFLLWRLDAAFRLVAASVAASDPAIAAAAEPSESPAPDAPPSAQSAQPGPVAPRSSADGIAARFAVAALGAAVLALAIWSARGHVLRPRALAWDRELAWDAARDLAPDVCDPTCMELRRLSARPRRAIPSPDPASVAREVSAQEATVEEAATPLAAAPAAPHAPPPEVRLAAGRTSEWWRDRLRALAQRQDEEGKRLYALTRERAQLNGLRVLDGADGPWVRFEADGSAP